MYTHTNNMYTHKQHEHTHTQINKYTHWRGCEKGGHKNKEGERESEKQTDCAELRGITLAHTGLHFVSCGLRQGCLFTSWEPLETEN